MRPALSDVYRYLDYWRWRRGHVSQLQKEALWKNRKEGDKVFTSEKHSEEHTLQDMDIDHEVVNPGLDLGDRKILARIAPDHAPSLLDILLKRSIKRSIINILMQDILQTTSLPDGTNIGQLALLASKLAHTLKCVPKALLWDGDMPELDAYDIFEDPWPHLRHGRLVDKDVSQKVDSSRHMRWNIAADIVANTLVWRSLQHENLVPFIGIYPIDPYTDQRTSLCPETCNARDGICLATISSWMPNGPILQYLSAHIGEAISILTLLQDIARGLAFLHENGVAYMILTPDVIFIDHNGHALIADNVLASIFSSEVEKRVLRNSRAPKSTTWHWKRSRPMNMQAADVYSFGCVCLAIYTMQPPFRDLPDHAVRQAVMDGIHPPRPSAQECPFGAPSDAVWALMTRCWNRNPQKRPTMKEVVGVLNGLEEIGRPTL